jgi:hypothetical protein
MEEQRMAKIGTVPNPPPLTGKPGGTLKPPTLPPPKKP